MERLVNLGGLILVQKISNTCATTLKSTSLAVDRGDSKFYSVALRITRLSHFCFLLNFIVSFK